MVTKAKDSLISSLKLLFKDDVTKDARLLCIDGKVLRAHRCILFARCPALKTVRQQLVFLICSFFYLQIYLFERHS